MANETQDRWKELVGVKGNIDANMLAELSGSSGDRERGKFRPSKFPRLFKVAVSNDDGTAIALHVEEKLDTALEAFRELVEQGKQPINNVWPNKPIDQRLNLIQTIEKTIPGMHTGSAYASGDALGTKFEIIVPTVGVIVAAYLTDMDKEELAVDFLAFNDDFVGGTDDSAFDLSDADRHRIAVPLTISSYMSFNDNSLGYWTGARAYLAPEGKLYIQAITRGAQNLTALTDYALSLVIEDHSNVVVTN